MFFYICYQLKIPKQRKSISQPFVLLFWIFQYLSVVLYLFPWNFQSLSLSLSRSNRTDTMTTGFISWIHQVFDDSVDLTSLTLLFLEFAPQTLHLLFERFVLRFRSRTNRNRTKWGLSLMREQPFLGVFCNSKT